MQDKMSCLPIHICKFLDANFWKPKNCPSCNFEIGGNYVPKPKKPKLIKPDCVHVGKNLFSVKTNTRGDRCFVVFDNETRFCEHEKCKARQAVTVASTETSVAQFSWPHIEMVQKSEGLCNTKEMTSKMVSEYPCDDTTRKKLLSLLPNLNEMPAVVLAGDGCYIVYGPPSSGSTMGYTHLFVNSNTYKCTSKNCKVQSIPFDHETTCVRNARWAIKN